MRIVKLLDCLLAIERTRVGEIPLNKLENNLYDGGIMDIKIRDKNWRLKLSITDKISVISGDGGTGKSTIVKMLFDSKRCPVISVPDGYSYLIYNDSELERKGLAEVSMEKCFIFIDECRVRFDKEFISIVHESANVYFIFITRENIRQLNFNLYANYKLVVDNGIVVNVPMLYINNVRKLDSIDLILMEDKGKGFQWFYKLFRHSGIDYKIRPAGYIDENLVDFIEIDDSEDIVKLSVKKNSYKSLDCIGGMSNIINTLTILMTNEININILLIIDQCSFGCYVDKLLAFSSKYRGSLFILKDEKSFEYLLLNTNQFKDKMVEYNIGVSTYEERYYELELDRLSAGRHSRISHDKRSDIPLCYLRPCCSYRYSKDNNCKVGLKNVWKDQFCNMLIGTKFEYLLSLTRRL